MPRYAHCTRCWRSSNCSSPKRVVEVGERLALENPGEATLRPWVPLVVRLEGLVVLVALVRPPALPGPLRSMLGWLGLLAVLSPRGFLRYWTDLVYEDVEVLAWKPWVVPATRAVGVLYVSLALFGRKSGNDER